MRPLLWLAAASLGAIAVTDVAASLQAVVGEPQLTGVNGKPATLAASRAPLTLLNFWASWCQPCREEMPDLDRLHAELSPRGFAVVGVAADDLPEVKAFLAKLPVRYPLLVGNSDEVFAWTEKLGNRALGLPYSVLLDATGRVVWRKSGGRLTREEALRAIEPLLPMNRGKQ